MLNNITLDKMHSLKLFGMLEAFEHVKQTLSLQTLSFTEGLSLLVDQETLYRDNKRIARLTKIAKLRYPQAMIEDINHEHKRTIAREQFQWLIHGQ